MSRTAKLMAGVASTLHCSEDKSLLNRDSNSKDYATVTYDDSASTAYMYLSSFGFNSIPSSAIVSSAMITIKMARLATSNNFTISIKTQYADGKALTTNVTVDSRPQPFRIDLASMWDSIDQNLFEIRINVYPSSSNPLLFYGADIQVEYDLPVNKVVYGTTVLVDLTEDTVTPDDLSEGVTAHDKSGGLITGTNQRGIMVIRDSSDSHGGTVRTITSGEAQVGGMTEADLKNFIQRSSSFTDIDWPDGLSGIGDYVFAGCRYFNPSSLPSSLTNIGSYAFRDCQRLSLTSLPSGVTYIGSGAFQQCNNLALTSLPSRLKTIENSAFLRCNNLTLTELPSGITTIYSYAFQYCYNLALTRLPDGMTSINSYAFDSCYKLITMTCEGVITTLGVGAFTGNASYPMALTSVSFPNMALTSNISTVFGSSTAANACQQLAFCDIGSTVGIAGNAFANCHALQTLVLRKTASVCSLANVSAFLNTPMRGYNSLTGTVYVPQALIESYKTATNWSTLYNDGTVTFVAIEGSQYERE